LHEYQSYEMFEVYLTTLNNSEKGRLFEEFTKEILKIHPYYSDILTDIWLYEEIPHSLTVKHKLPKIDKGIDLLAVINGNYYPIQCKFRSKKNKIIYNEIATFPGLCFDRFNNGIVVTNSYEVCEELHTDNMLILDSVFFASITNEMYKNIILNMTNTSVKYETPHPYDYQIIAINDACKHYESNKNGILDVACGGGKTFMSFCIIKKLNVINVIVVVPSLYLLSQILLEYSKYMKFNKLVVGSDIYDKNI